MNNNIFHTIPAKCWGNISLTLEKAMVGDLGKSLWLGKYLVLFMEKIDLCVILECEPSFARRHHQTLT